MNTRTRVEILDPPNLRGSMGWTVGGHGEFWDVAIDGGITLKMHISELRAVHAARVEADDTEGGTPC